MSGPTGDLQEELRASALRAALAAEVASTLEVDHSLAVKIVEAFDKFVARPLTANLAKLRGNDLARRNPMIYTARGTRTVDEWVTRVIKDRETSAIEGHIGTWLEEVAQIVSGGIKPGSGVDLQLTTEDDGTILYAIQSAGNTKNAGSRKSDIDALKRAAKPLRAHKKHVDLRIAVLWGRPQSGEVRDEPDIRVVGSDEFWDEISGVVGFRTRLLSATVALSQMLGERSEDEVARIRQEATQIFALEDGELDLAKVANPPKASRRKAVKN